MYVNEIAWSPVIKNTDRVNVFRDQVDIIAKCIANQHKAGMLPDSYSLFTGKSGIALFLYEYYRMTGEQDWFDLSTELLSSCIEQIERIPIASQYYTYCGGLAGFATALDFFKEQELTEEDGIDILGKQFPQILKKQAQMYLSRNEFDYLHGAIGIMIYLVSIGMDIRDLVKHLISLAEESGEEMTWPVIVPYGINKKGINFSLSHGMTSILYFFTYYVEKTGLEEYIPVIEKIINYFLNNENTRRKSMHSVFPSYIIPESETESVRDSRMGWCYGDMGFSTVLYKAATLLKREDWKGKAVQTMKLCTLRKEYPYTKVIDACFCHGAIGIAHIFNRMNDQEKNPELDKAAIHWYDNTLAYYNAKGIDGYMAWRTEEYGGPKLLVGLLDGITGIGLGYLHAITDKEPYWDKILLLS